MRMTKQVCLMTGTKVGSKVNMLIAEVVADIIKGKAHKIEQSYYFVEQDDDTGKKKKLEFASTAYEAAVKSKKYFQKPLETIRINRLTKSVLEFIQSDYNKQRTKERLEKFAAEFESLKRKYNVYLRTDSDDEYVEIEAVDCKFREESIVITD